MKFFIEKVISQKASHIYLSAIVLQLIVCYTRVCKPNEIYDFISSGKFGSEKHPLNSLFLKPNNFTLRPDPGIDNDLLQKLPIRPGMVHFATEKPYTLPSPQSVKRSKRNDKQTTELVQDVCPSISDWVARPEAFDPYGNKLRIVQRIPINGTVINQYFYETFCAHNIDFGNEFSTNRQNYNHINTECRGIDKQQWSSRCRENFIWTYGKVVTNSGEIGWSVIAIRGSCGCAIWPKPNDAIGRGRRVSPKQSHNYEDNNLLLDPFF